MAHELHRQYPAVPATPGLARRQLADYLTDHRPLVPVATLLVSELVTNSVVHASGPIDLHACFVGATLRVDVQDTCSEMPRLRAPDDSGRGLHIVASLATKWGATPLDGHGKTTWFELNAHR